MARLFGTDGVRGVAGRDLTAALALELSVAAARVLTRGGDGARPKAVVGRDPRASGEFLEAAVVAGLASTGVDVVRVGVLPTPAVAYLTGALGADFGVMLSASHNPAPDNGIKFFARGGQKLEDALEEEIEGMLGVPSTPAVGDLVGRVTDADDGAERYVEHVLASVPHSLKGLKVVVDCANGASALVAPEALRRAGAEVVAIGDQPDGHNINDGCGSTHLEVLQEAVRLHGADAGIANDGDADRCLAVDAEGRVVDGDQILAILATEAKEEGRLAQDTLVVTVMSNLGLKLAMEREGITVVETAVGDRYVLEEMKRGGFGLGGEQSGHVILLEHATTGDGVLTGLHLLAAMAHREQGLAELAKVMTRLPQVLVNVPDVDKARAKDSAELAAAVREAEEELGETGRVLIRPSGTEPKVRVMVEAPEQEQATAVAERLAAVVRSALG
ncbi:MULTISPECIES: phosphoglucosamine mutase [Nocardiopsis]|uniref:Phosphoglucosamine mutase n=1 Tax=Nocardiopsis dassonvillei (strain ATCC 23218 / DSM 43111 / CIP 107115 / JCM 7437 / KCTC 9190 / NBRC 14626 / NCTC 10488 / NRRL B-5397 / IMRU 509) TaxID=446468 RepID=D7B8N2_NOCDD|nr:MULTISPECIES: phosphoglucosamine mutase [Nocardiopsis]ADH70540.1 phosphoglucosamine mutase [Nocardiopsis dassonvillei subsp. dassonvillei DSM 43111]APC33810.1 phosphoglucosamine mutase [Nocardiopsis dassonvillei]MCK9872691.1 phosphoglucosamine mutase [Nocardiopsis dassonvillei]MCP3015872.1 phosphoglucosamine mutase [Nocardiopsis dassonvillei]NKY82303.1 phosphoglucosamine mutase [Nocardiopsis dassonvillei]